VLRVTRAHVLRERRGALQLLRMPIISVPKELRHLTRMQLIRTIAPWRPDVSDATDTVTAYRVSMRSLARRYLELTDEEPTWTSSSTPSSKPSHSISSNASESASKSPDSSS
jgi:hypothetical protein